MKLLYSQAGYHTFSDKAAIVATSPEVNGGHFALVQDGHEVLRANLQPLGAAPGDAHWLADFTRVRTTGWNELHVALSNGERARTPSFRISPVTYRGMAKETLLWLNPQRCGTRIEFWHGACHRDDPALGGWHCGDSWDKRADDAWLAVWSCATLDALVRDFTVVPGESMPHIVYESAWGGEWLLKLQGEDGRFGAGVQSPLRLRSGQAGVGVRCEDDTNLRELGEPLGIPTCAMIGYALCQLSTRVRRFQPSLADRCLESAAQAWRTYRETKPSSEGSAWHSAFALLDLGLCCAIAARKNTFELNLPDNEPARTDLERRIDGLLCRREFGRPDLESFAGHSPWAEALALIEFVDKFPESERSELARATLTNFCEVMRNHSHASDYSLVPPRVTNDRIEEAWSRGNSYILSTAFVFARAAEVLGRFDLLPIAERHVQWVWGRNPLAVSMMCGAGADPNTTARGPQTGMRGLGVWFTPNAVYRGHEDGYQVGGVGRGILPDHNGEPFLDVRTLDDERDRKGLECNRDTNAYSLPATAWMMLACCAVDRALERMHGGA